MLIYISCIIRIRPATLGNFFHLESIFWVCNEVDLNKNSSRSPPVTFAPLRSFHRRVLKKLRKFLARCLALLRFRLKNLNPIFFLFRSLLRCRWTSRARWFSLDLSDKSSRAGLKFEQTNQRSTSKGTCKLFRESQK